MDLYEKVVQSPHDALTVGRPDPTRYAVCTTTKTVFLIEPIDLLF